MTRQNVYDNAAFFDGYARLRNSRSGLHEKIIEPHLPELLPTLEGKRVVDLGCGDGWFCSIARDRGAVSVVGIDPSERMLDLARTKNADIGVTFVRAFAEDAQLAPGSADVVASILALHYVRDLDSVIARVASWLVQGGVFVGIVEHPIATSQNPKSGFATDTDGRPYWPVTHYFDEGERREHWFIDGVVKYHRPFSTILDAFLEAGLRLDRVTEPTPHIAAETGFSDEDSIRPAILGLRAIKP